MLLAIHLRYVHRSEAQISGRREQGSLYKQPLDEALPRQPIQMGPGTLSLETRALHREPAVAERLREGRPSTIDDRAARAVACPQPG